jgi:hypothetical protein
VILLAVSIAACWPPAMASALANHEQIMTRGGSGDSDTAFLHRARTERHLRRQADPL